MARSDRLYDLIVILRDGGIYKAIDLAQQFGVSLRTIYRDMDILMKSGLPIVGEPGTGYRIAKMITLPPLNLSKVELEALDIGLALCTQIKDEQLSNAARSLSQKISNVLSENPHNLRKAWRLASYPFSETVKAFGYIDSVRNAIRARQKCKIFLHGEDAPHIVRPLTLDYWGRVWTLRAWCETHDQLTIFRLDKFDKFSLINALFVDDPDKN